jgi:hypothetical protein
VKSALADEPEFDTALLSLDDLLTKALAPASVNRYISTLDTVFKELRRLPRGFSNPMCGFGHMMPGDWCCRSTVTSCLS